MILTTAEKAFLDVFLNEATVEPFGGPATRLLKSQLGLNYCDIPAVLTAYEHENPLTSWPVGYRSDSPPPLPWPERESALRREKQLANFIGSRIPGKG